MKKAISLGSVCIQPTPFLLLLFSLILLTGLINPVFASSMDEAKTAYKSKDFSRARSLLEPLARNGNRNAMYMLGTMIRKGQGGIKDEDQAYMWWLKSAERNFGPAMMLLGKIKIGEPEGQKDWPQGCMWFRRAAERGNKEGMFFTGICYLTGEGAPETPEDYVQSLAWFMASERKGYADATRFRKDLEKIVTPEQIPMARELSKTLGKVKKPKNPVKTASAGPQPKQAMPKPSLSPPPAQPMEATQ